MLALDRLYGMSVLQQSALVVKNTPTVLSCRIDGITNLLPSSAQAGIQYLSIIPQTYSQIE